MNPRMLKKGVCKRHAFTRNYLAFSANDNFLHIVFALF